MFRFSSIIVFGTVLILLIAGFLISNKNIQFGMITKLLASVKENILSLFISQQPKVVNAPVLEEEDLKEEQIIQEEEDIQEEPEINSDLNFEEIVEKIDEIAEKVDILSQEIEKLINQNIEKNNDIEVLEEKEEETEKELEETEEETVEEVKTSEFEVILCEKNGQSPIRDKIIFNEISWMGTSEDWRDEWIELKNISDREVSLNGWQVLDKNQEIKIIFDEKDVILGGRFYLLERTNDNSIPNVFSDKIYSGNLNDEDEILYLFNENCQLQDEVLALSNWPAGDKNERKSMERDSDLSWYTYSGSINFGILGTPKAENSPKIISSSGGGAPPEEEIPAVPPLKILISEIFFDAEGSDEEQEFIELFNPNDSEIDLSSYSIQYLSSNADLIEKVEKKNFEEGSKIEAKSYFLIGLNGREEDLKWSQVLGNNGGSIILVNDKEKITGIEDLNIVDRVGYGLGEGLILAETLVVSLEDFKPGRSLGRKWLEQTEEYQDLDNNQQDFEMQEVTPRDKSLEIIIPEPIDDIPPEVSFNAISSIQTENSFSLSWVGQDLSFENVTPSGIDGFYLQYYSTPFDIDGITIQYQNIDNSWQEWEVGQILDFEENQNYVNLLAEEGINYSFQIKAKDKAGNESEWIEIKIEVNTLPVVINEIAWMGTSESASNEWIELCINTFQEIDLSNWKLLEKGGETLIITLENQIESGGYYLIERTNDETVPNIPADIFGPFSGSGLSNDGEYLVLKDNNDNIIDEVNFSSGWPEGKSSPEYIPMERINPNFSGADINNWKTSQEIGGTPRAQNSQ